MADSEAFQDCRKPYELCQSLPRRTFCTSLHGELQDRAIYTASLSRAHMQLGSKKEADGRRVICNRVAQCVKSHVQLRPADVTPHVDWAAADSVAGVLKQFMQRRQHCRLTGLQVEDDLQPEIPPSELSWEKRLSKCPWSNLMSLRKHKTSGSIARHLSLQSEHGATEKPMERNSPCLLSKVCAQRQATA